MHASQDLIESLFPFHLAFDRNLKIQGIGRGLQKLEPSLAAGEFLSDRFRLEQPDLEMSFEVFQGNPKLSIVFHPPSAGYRLRGHFFPHDSRDLLYYLGSPLAEDLEKLHALGISPQDFALLDVIPDLLPFLQTQRRMVSDLRIQNDNLSRQLEEQRAHNALLVDQQREVERLAIVAARTENPVIITDSQDRIE